MCIRDRGQGLGVWGHDSQIDHAVADSPMGVFVKADTALPAEAHNASPLMAPNGSILLFHIGNSDPAHAGGLVHFADNPNGPWQSLPSIGCNNPAPLVANNGSVFVGCNNGGFSIWRSDNIFSGKWQKVTTLEFPSSWGAGSSPYLRNEDPYIWMDVRENWHLLAHRYDYRDGWPTNPNQTSPVLVSGHGYSEDGLTWLFNSVQQPYDAQITFENGTRQFFSTWERPHLVLEKGVPTYLVNGVSPYWNRDKPCDKCEPRPGSAHSCVVCKTTSGLDYTYTLVTKLNVPQHS
eukprot:TRINITY_DN5785_c0_g1_i2.p1 TRINITY_DN5785_c0_g1~~TRINITY_DN5785_c0_g1_i2.p1  ORF type:complete len:291 (+),score=36.21 TRINITY_DN5785_c0_g1_i2:118-990(+)